MSGQVLSFSSLKVLEESRGLRGAFLSNRVRIHPNSKKKPATTSSPGDDARRWREGASTRRDAEIVPDRTQRVVYYLSLADLLAAVVADHKRIRQGKGVALFEILRPDDVNFYRAQSW